MLHLLPNENRRNINLPQNNSSYGLLQNNAYGRELVLFCLIFPCVHCLFMFYFYKKRKWLFWFCVHRHRSMRSIVQSIDRTVIDPCIRIECKLRSSLRSRRDRSRAQSFGMVEEKKPHREWGGDALKSRLPED